MSLRSCRDDPLMQLLNDKGYQPIALPRSNVVPADIYIFDESRLRYWRRLDRAVPAGSLPEKPNEGALADIETKRTRAKSMEAAASFLQSALRAIGVSGSPSLDLSVVQGRDLAFSFTGLTWRGLDPGDVAAALHEGFNVNGIPQKHIGYGHVHIAYEYAYARSLNMTVGTTASGSAQLTGAQVPGIVDLGAKAKAELVEGTTIRFTAENEAVAFACKLGRVEQRRDGGWDFQTVEAVGLGAGPIEAPPEPYILRRGEILFVDDLKRSRGVGHT